jgi:hypothetical protein
MIYIFTRSVERVPDICSSNWSFYGARSGPQLIFYIALLPTSAEMIATNIRWEVPLSIMAVCCAETYSFFSLLSHIEYCFFTRNGSNGPKPWKKEEEVCVHENIVAFYCVRFQVLTAASMKLTAFWYIAPCSRL